MRATFIIRARAAQGLHLAALLAVGLALAGWQPARAAPAADPIIHVVQPGETLFGIGLQYGISWIDIQQANQLSSTIIYSGQQLLIPAGDPAVSVPPASDVPPADEAPPAPPQPAESTTYIVQAGDYLSRIAKQYGVTTSAIAVANNLSNPSLIYPGQTLIIPGANDVPVDPAAPPPAPASSDKLILVDLSEQRMYVYQDGSLLWNWVVSTGEPGLETLPGTYSVLDKIPNAYAWTWDLQMPDWLGIYWAGSLENGIHALPILSNGQRLWDGYLGTRVSFGCVILGVADAQTLFDWAEVGTTVTIQN